MIDPVRNDTILLYAPVPLYKDSRGEVHVERQAVNGLRLWAANFSRVIVMMPLGAGAPPAGWVPVSGTGESLKGVRLETLPMAYRPDQFLRHLGPTRRKIRSLINESRYLSFAIGGLFGDWGAVASFTARSMKRPFAVWTDRVESDVVRLETKQGTFRSRTRARLTHRPMAALERAIIRRAALGLFHGRETFDFYQRFCSAPCEVVHDIHISADDHIDNVRLASKRDSVGQGPLRIVYAGRADAMKGPLQWIEVLENLKKRGVDFRATWLGDGLDRPEMMARVAKAGMQDQVDLPGFMNDKDTVLAAMRDAHVFMFCHLTPESPRCLIESLASGTPIIGYASPYSADLIAANNGGILVPRGDVAALTQAIETVASDRDRLATLIDAAFEDGKDFTDDAVFNHRSDVIRRHLSQ